MFFPGSAVIRISDGCIPSLKKPHTVPLTQGDKWVSYPGPQNQRGPVKTTFMLPFMLQQGPGLFF